jgi:hypothetical protein
MSHVTLSSPADVLAAVPYLLGFHPTNSIVLVGLRRLRVIFQARADAPRAVDIDELASYLAAIAARQSPTAVILIGYGPEHPVKPALAALRAAIEALDLPIVDVLRVLDGRYWSLSCADQVCCPADGTPFDPSATAMAAAATFEGLVALPDRAALVNSLATLPGPGIEPELARAHERLKEVLAGGSRRRRVAARVAVREAFERHAAGGRLDDDEVAWLAVLIADDRARDDAWQRMLAGQRRAAYEQLWRDVLRRAPRRYRPAPATLLALAAWRAGDGATASVAAAAALDVDPTYALARLVQQALRAGVPPDILDGPPEPRRRRARVRVR